MGSAAAPARSPPRPDGSRPKRIGPERIRPEPADPNLGRDIPAPRSPGAATGRPRRGPPEGGRAFWRRVLIALAGAIAAISAPLAGAAGAAQTLEPSQPAAPGEPRRWRFDAFPTTDPYPPNTASPHRLTNSVELLSVGSVGIEDSGESRFALRLGGRFGVLRLARGDRVLQLGIEAGFASHFDNDFDQDNIGWDGHYGLTLTAGHGEALAWKVGLFHTSAHVGDEYAERTSRLRIGYTREEAVGGVSYRVTPRLRAYLETAYAYELRIPVQQPWRVQGGLVLEDADRFAGGRFGWYAATDVARWEERDWRTDWAVQVGLVYPAGDRAWRLGVTVHDGRPPLGEFFQDTERYVSAGLSVDL